tara:strand:+ start:166 stop:330 length:165 start_codon:yes stop_codon:yes gene_type:complete
LERKLLGLSYKKNIARAKFRLARAKMGQSRKFSKKTKKIGTFAPFLANFYHIKN